MMGEKIERTGNTIDWHMRWLIDGYNVMHAGGRLGAKLGREGFRRARRRFLDDLSAALGAEIARETTVVFDASAPPGDFRLDTDYRGLAVVFALGDENADARIEQLIATHSNPKALTVVSSDRRIRQAAARRRSRSLTAEEYWVLVDEYRERTGVKSVEEPLPSSTAPERDRPPTSAESAFWVKTFGEIADDASIQQSLAPSDSLLTDADIKEIERQIERES
jgi:predicted RNA-binding protein with PIN domain